jgi:hypothetical protein
MEADIATASNQRPPLMEINGGAIALPASVNQSEKRKKRKTRPQARRAHPRVAAAATALSGSGHTLSDPATRRADLEVEREGKQPTA